MLTKEQVQLVRDSFKQVFDRRPELVEIFYTRLFVTEPNLRDAFPQGGREQEIKLESTLQLALLSLERAELLVPALKDLGVKHGELGVTEGQYHIFNEILLDTLAAEAGEFWTLEVSHAWNTVLQFISKTMIDGANEAARGAA